MTDTQDPNRFGAPARESSTIQGTIGAPVRLSHPPANADVTLANGRIVSHARQPNGSQLASMADGGEMSHAEWDEYCQLIHQ